MSLVPGTRLGPYEVVAPLGRGGMGEVYRATDPSLGRQVAIKVVPTAFAHDPDRVARFEREAKTLAALNHPNIAAIYGLERSSGMTALVMELVEGPTLADRIEQGAIPIDEALPIARQIAEALEAAHEQGVIHRDLKPANIKVRPDGTVKVLDFGLAKAMDPAGQGFSPAGYAGSEDQASVPFSQAPTITTPAMMTGVGVILGTAAYMSPEQACGKVVDKRTDIWAFGCVLYEMLSGQRAFGGEDVTVSLARVVEREPDFEALPPTVPTRVRQALRVCLRKDLKQRAHDMADVRLALDGAFETAMSGAAVSPAGVPPWRRTAILTAAALVVASLTASGVWFFARPAGPVPARVSRLVLALSDATTLSLDATGRDLAITPDGSRVIYVGNNGTQLFVRALDALEPVAVFTGAPSGPFVSPDGAWIGFIDSSTTLKKVAVTGGPAIALSSSIDSTTPRGATWGPDDGIIFATSNGLTGLQRVGADGVITVLTRPDLAQGESDHALPEMLPGGHAVLFTITAATGGNDAAQVAVLDLGTRTWKILVRGGFHAHYVPSGHLVYAAAGTLWAVPFDPDTLETRGTPVAVIPDVVTAGGTLEAVVAGDGTLAYVSGSRPPDRTPRTLVWVDRQGRETPIPAPPRNYVYPRLSPDGTRVAVFSNDRGNYIWLWDLGRATLTRATFDPSDQWPLWAPDGRRLIFGSQRNGARNLYSQIADGTGAVNRLTESANAQNPTAVSPDGRQVIFTENVPKTSADVMQVELDGAHRVTPLVQSPFIERNGVISPDGRWLAYEANASGMFETYVRPYPEVNSGRWQVSTAGGTRPLWARGGQELLYVSLTGALMRVDVLRDSSWVATTPELLVAEGYYTGETFLGRAYDVAPDGQRFLMIKEGTAGQTAAPPQLIVVQNWQEELKRLAPVD